MIRSIVLTLTNNLNGRNTLVKQRTPKLPLHDGQFINHTAHVKQEAYARVKGLCWLVVTKEHVPPDRFTFLLAVLLHTLGEWLEPVIRALFVAWRQYLVELCERVDALRACHFGP